MARVLLIAAMSIFLYGCAVLAPDGETFYLFMDQKAMDVNTYQTCIHTGATLAVIGSGGEPMTSEAFSQLKRFCHIEVKYQRELRRAATPTPVPTPNL